MKAIRFLLENSLFLIFGAIGGLLWANLDNEGYQHILHLELINNHLFYDHAVNAAHPEKHVMTLHYLVNDIFMAFFFAIAGKEVWEATLPGGPLSDPRKAATPLIATIGGMVGPALLYVACAAYIGQLSELGNGWAIPCATDIAFSFLVARIVFGVRHPGIPFLRLLAIADDALGLLILAVFYPTGELHLGIYVVVLALALTLAWWLRSRRTLNFWPYVLGAGMVSWLAFFWGGLHPALALVPIMPFMPHAARDAGLFVERPNAHDTLNEFEHWWKNPVEIILGLFGLANAGVVFTSVGDGTWLVLAGLLIGKPLGVALFTILGQKVLRLELPVGMSFRDLLVVGMVAGIGFTVALFVATAAFPGDSKHLDAVKMGALGSFAAAFLAIAGARAMGIRPGSGTAEPPASAETGKLEDDPGGAEDPS